MDASWPLTWPEPAELHIFDPAGDVLLIYDRCVKEVNPIEYMDGEKRPNTPECGFVLEHLVQAEDEVPPLSPNIADQQELNPSCVPSGPQAEIPKPKRIMRRT